MLELDSKAGARVPSGQSELGTASMDSRRQKTHRERQQEKQLRRHFRSLKRTRNKSRGQSQSGEARAAQVYIHILRSF